MAEEKCPYNCVDGIILNPYTHKKEDCPNCKQKRLAKLRNGEVADELKLPPSLCGSNFSRDAIIPKYKLGLLDKESVDNLMEKIDEWMKDITLGVLPKESILINFGSSCHDANFIAPFVKKAYEAGLSVAPVMSPSDIITARRAQMLGLEDYDGIEYQKIINNKLCIIVIDAGTLSDEILAVKGVMQLRARINLPTIMVTHIWNNSLMTLQACNGESCYDLASLYAVKYNKSSSNMQGRLPLDAYNRGGSKAQENVGIM